MYGQRIKITFIFRQKKFKQLEQKKKTNKNKKQEKKWWNPANMSLWIKIQKLIKAIRNFH